MNTQIQRLAVGATMTAWLLVLAGCGGGSSGSGGQMRLSVTDAPVDGALAVVVKFSGVELLPASGSPVTITFATPKTIDLLHDSGTASAQLFDQPIPSGAYTQIRMLVMADGNPSNSYITLADGTMHGLQVPSGMQTGLKLVSGFDVPMSGVADYTVDFDLRKAITCPPGQAPACLLKPALRLVANASVGNIQGIVDASLVTAGCTPGVYLYDGAVTSPEDYDSTAPAADMNQPRASRMPVQTADGLYYQFTFLAPGSYTVAYTCEAAADDPDQPDPAVVFAPTVTGIGVAAGETVTQNLP
ncbi:MAG: DUF4382 domain-containing protein [Steroidobacteraceae bacterium]